MIFGDDIACDPQEGIPATFEMASERTALVQAIVRRFQTRRGTLVDDPDYGLDLTDWVGKRTDTAQLFAWQQALQGEALKDERIQSARARMTLTPQGGLRFTLALGTALGPFVLTLQVGDLSVELLSVEEG
jgi:hypothetical protein